MRHCEFCDEFSGGTRNGFVGRYASSVRSRLLVDTPQAKVLPSLGQIVEGHLLIVPTEHLCALADLSFGQLAEVNNLTRWARSVLEANYGRCIFFEHGIRSHGSGGCGIDHAHMHAVPVVAEGVLEILRREFEAMRVDSFESIGRVLPDSSSYLFFEDASEDKFVFPVTNLPSQYMRRLVAESIGKSTWNWRTSGYEPELISTLHRLSTLFSLAAAGSQG